MSEDVPQYPLFRVKTFGHFVLEQLISSEKERSPRYKPIADHVWRSRFAACDLLKFLLCRLHRRASKDVLIEALWPDVELSSASHSFDTAISRLRSILTFENKESLLITRRASGTVFYELPSQQILWADSDAFLTLLSQAEQATSRGLDPLSLLEAAWQHSSGIFLEDNLYNSWAQVKRQTINTSRHRVLHQLVKLYIQRGRADQAEAMLLSALEEEPTDEDSVCRLITLLEQQGRRQDALRCYERLVTVLKEDEIEPLLSTQALAKHLYIASSKFVPVRTPPEVEIDIHVTATPRNLSEPALFAVTIPHLSSNSYRSTSYSLSRPARGMYTTNQHLSSLIVPEEKLCSHLLLYRIIKEICYWTGREDFQDTLPMIIKRLMKELDTMEQQHIPAVPLLSRRDALLIIAGLPLALLTRIQTDSITNALLEEFLAQCTASLVTCWYLLKGTEFQQVESILSAYLPQLEKLAHQSSKYQKTAAHLAAQCRLLFATLTLHQNNLLDREAHCKQAVRLGQIAEDTNLSVTALKWLAVTYYYTKCPSKALQTYQEIAPFLSQVSPLLRGSMYIKMANTYAQCGQEQDALRYLRLAHEHFPENPEQDPCFLYADCGRQSLPIWEGLTYLDLGQPENAWNALQRVEQLSAIMTVPERARVEALNHQAETALALGDQELFSTYIEKGIHGAKALASEKRYNEALDVYRQARRIWSREPRIKELQDLFH